MNRSEPKFRLVETTPTSPIPRALAGSLAPHILHIKQAQDTTLEEMRTFSERWFERRRATLTCAADAANARGGSVGDYVTAALNCQRLAFDLAAEDVSDWLAMWQHCAAAVTENELSAEAEVIEAVPAAGHEDVPI